VLSLSCLVLLTSATLSAVVKRDARGAMDWDFLLFVQRWPGSVTQKRLPSNITDFVMHGMWPERNDNTWPQFCTGTQFTPTKVAAIRSQLLEHWPDLEKNDPNGFWSHEYDKHGTCAADGTAPSIADELSFFKLALKLQSQFSLLTALSNAQITPDPSATYSVSAITNAVSNAVGGQSVISCKTNGSEHHLERVYVCVNKMAAVEDCPTGVVSGLTGKADCGGGQNVMIPPIQH